jgi:hypothetical protein
MLPGASSRPLRRQVLERFVSDATLDGFETVIQCRSVAACIVADPKTRPLPQALVLASFDLVHTANRPANVHAIAHHNAIHFRIADVVVFCDRSTSSCLTKC